MFRKQLSPLSPAFLRCLVAVFVSSQVLVGTAFAACPEDRRPEEMSTEEIRNEMYGIRSHRADIGLYHSEGDKIQLDSRCTEYWQRMKRIRSEYDNMAGKDFYTEKVNELKQRYNSNKQKFQSCFNEELKNHPKIYEHALIPAKNIGEFEANLAHLEEQFRKECMAARFSDLSAELKKRRQ